MNNFELCSFLDYNQIVRLLESEGLPYSDISFEKQYFWKYQHNGFINALAAIEPYGASAIFRSFIVDPQMRGTGLGFNLYSHVLNEAKNRDIKNLYLLTTNADQWFLRNGWQIIQRSEVPDAIANSAEFKSICPASAICMVLDL